MARKLTLCLAAFPSRFAAFLSFVFEVDEVAQHSMSDGHEYKHEHVDTDTDVNVAANLISPKSKENRRSWLEVPKRCSQAQSGHGH